ncbi:mannose-specific lectin-like isoform X2 [Xyrichtys novacula]|uniref:Mannose-specific lectin-like isoform X2 n=1 Tax=Xyrichtys novacula TaxID=13765 RepID=A0AAV1HE48_XYRNO|nr:mannose-specific lectin-like isoform X2 [Xyrichtys novacula]
MNRTNPMNAGEVLQKGDFLMSPNGQWKATLQADGNLLIYNMSTSWRTEIAPSDGSHLKVEPNGDVVIYNNNEAKWRTNTGTPSADVKCTFKLTDEGKLVVSHASAVKWSKPK